MTAKHRVVIADAFLACRAHLPIKELPQAEDKDIWLPVERPDGDRHRGPVVSTRPVSTDGLRVGLAMQGLTSLSTGPSRLTHRAGQANPRSERASVRSNAALQRWLRLPP